MKAKGFTLIELMITVAVVAILAGIAIPSYRNQMLKAHRADGKTALEEIVQRQAKLRANCRFYGVRSDTTNTCGTTAALSSFAYPGTSKEGYYTLSVTLTGLGTQGYVATATATGGQTDDTACTPLTITISAANPEGVRAPTACW